MKVNAQKEKAETEKADKAAAVNAQAKGKGKGKGSGKGQGKKNDKDRLCGFIKKGEECSYGKDCKYSHNKKAFNADGTKKVKGSNSQTPATDEDKCLRVCQGLSGAVQRRNQGPACESADCGPDGCKRGCRKACGDKYQSFVGAARGLVDIDGV